MAIRKIRTQAQGLYLMFSEREKLTIINGMVLVREEKFHE